MKPVISIAITLALVVLLSACVPHTGELNCKTGTAGISAKFVSSNFPDQIQQDVETPVLIELTNSGAYTAKEVKVRLNYNEDFFSTVGKRNVTWTDVEGKAQWNKCTPQLRRDQYLVKAFPLPFATTKFDRPLTLDLCYNYGNNFSTSVCVDPAAQKVDALQPACTPSGHTFTGGQGSPLGITKVDAPTFVPNSQNKGMGTVRIGFHLRNFGDGSIFANVEPNAFDQACTYQSDTLKDYIYMKVFLDNYRLDCNILPGPDANPPQGKIFMRYDPQKIQQQDGTTTTLKDYYVECQNTSVQLSNPLSMTLDAEMYYDYRETKADERMTTIRKI